MFGLTNLEIGMVAAVIYLMMLNFKQEKTNKLLEEISILLLKK
jgi:hypothetical protein